MSKNIQGALKIDNLKSIYSQNYNTYVMWHKYIERVSPIQENRGKLELAGNLKWSGKNVNKSKNLKKLLFADSDSEWDFRDFSDSSSDVSSSERDDELQEEEIETPSALWRRVQNHVDLSLGNLLQPNAKLIGDIAGFNTPFSSILIVKNRIIYYERTGRIYKRNCTPTFVARVWKIILKALSKPDQVLNLKLPVIRSLVYCKSSIFRIPNFEKLGVLETRVRKINLKRNKKVLI
uniref:Uncharacterized protein n=1 Tax=Timema cristinae TaxID=61476 RepID=A0A7R9GSJ9_TIMCR|nr:unnamed protein product [Timema cristinae]